MYPSFQGRLFHLFLEISSFCHYVIISLFLTLSILSVSLNLSVFQPLRVSVTESFCLSVSLLQQKSNGRWSFTSWFDFLLPDPISNRRRQLRRRRRRRRVENHPGQGQSKVTLSQVARDRWLWRPFSSRINNQVPIKHSIIECHCANNWVYTKGAPFWQSTWRTSWRT